MKSLALCMVLGVVSLGACSAGVVPVNEPLGAGWVKLGERVVNGGADHDTIGGHGGRYKEIMIVVEHGGMRLWDLVVTFGDGSTFSPGTRFEFLPESRSRVISLPGGERIIRRVDFYYGNIPQNFGRARVELWAR